MAEQIEELFPFYALGVLTEEEKAEVEAFVAVNPAAQAQLAETCRAAAALSYGAKPIEPSAQVKAAVLARINNKAQPISPRPAAPPSAGFFQRFWRGGGPAVPAFAGLSLILALFAGVWTTQLNNQVFYLQQQNLAMEQELSQLSQQLRPLQTENNRFKNDLAVQTGSLAALNEAVTPLQTENTALKQELAAQAEQLAALERQVDAQRPTETSVSAETVAALETQLAVQGEQLAALNGQVAQLQAINNNLGRELSTQRAVMAEVTSPDVQAMKISGTETVPQAYGQLIANPGEDKAVLIVAGLQPLEPGLVYQFWLVQAGQLRRAGTFSVDNSGLGLLQVNTDTPIGAYEAMGISIEPADAPDQPPNEMIMLGSFSS